MLCSVEPAVAVMHLAVEPEPVSQAILLLGGPIGVCLVEQPGADGTGPGIVLDVHLGLDDMSGIVGGNLVWLRSVSGGVEHEPSVLLPVQLELGLLLS